jgi:hypothetical protein
LNQWNADGSTDTMKHLLWIVPTNPGISGCNERVGNQSMKWPVCSKVLGSTLLSGGLRLVVSTSTTIFMSWQDDEYQNLLTSNVAAVDAANDLQQAAWRVYQETPGLPVSDEEIDRTPPREVFDNAMHRIRRRIGPGEVSLVQRVEANCQEVLEAAKETETTSDRSESGKRLAKLVTAISNDCRALIEINDQVIRSLNWRTPGARFDETNGWQRRGNWRREWRMNCGTR